MVNEMIEEVFPALWNEDKTKLKEMSKKDLAYEMFGAGAYLALSSFMKLQHEEGMKNKVSKIGLVQQGELQQIKGLVNLSKELEEKEVGERIKHAAEGSRQRNQRPLSSACN